MSQYHTTTVQYKKIIHALMRISMVFCGAGMFSLILSLSGTNAFFTDQATIDHISFHAGTWIPTLTMTVVPESPDGDDGIYTESPCVKVISDIDDVTIYYAVSGDHAEEGEIDEGVCFYPPEGETMLTVYAVNNENDDWKSKEITHEFSVAQQHGVGDVVINEIMWMGSFADDDDEWIELRNMTDHDIDLSHWDLDGAGKGSHGHLEIPHGYTIKADGYFLIIKKKWKDTEINLSHDLATDEGYVHVAKMHLAENGEKLVLRDDAKKTIDVAWKDAAWPDGWHGLFLHMSMERSEMPGDGTKKEQWHTCIDRTCNDTVYWKNEGLNFGTPGRSNSPKRGWHDDAYDDREQKEIEQLQDDSDEIKDVWYKHFKEPDAHDGVDKKVDDVIDHQKVVPLPSQNDQCGHACTSSRT